MIAQRVHFGSAPSVTTRLVALVLALSMMFVGAAEASDSGPQAERTAAIVSAAAFAAKADHPDQSPFALSRGMATAPGASVRLRDGVVSANSGAEGIALTLPAGAPTQGEVTNDGTLVLSGVGAYDIAVQAYEDGAVRVQTVLENESAPTSYTYSFDTDHYLELRADGGANLLRDVAAEQTGERAATARRGGLQNAESELVAVVAAPWAVDATGSQLPTQFTVEGGRLVQTIDTTGAQFPVVADPFVIPMIVYTLGTAARVLAPWATRAYAARRIQVAASPLVGRGYTSFDSFKNAHGSLSNYQWHHIVGQTSNNVSRFGTRATHNTNNLIHIPREVHQRCVNSWMAKSNVRMFGINSGSQTMRNHIAPFSFERQHSIGAALLRYCGVPI